LCGFVVRVARQTATTLFPYTTLFRSIFNGGRRAAELGQARVALEQSRLQLSQLQESVQLQYEQAWGERERARETIAAREATVARSEEHTSELQSRENLVCRLLLEKKK